MKVVITNMHTKKRIHVHEFLNEFDAIQYFREWCDEHEYEYKSDSKEAGGIGYDYRIEIVEAVNETL